ncbi:MAG: family 10 glycosylhydrolase [Bacteroidales bacterium]|jgi:hypothetical protein|nr:family 10 glycosylhydrolase [Bacteroidales bacterium]
MRKLYLSAAAVLFFIAAVSSAACSSGAPEKTSKPVMMWIDAEANFNRFSNKDSVEFYMRKLKNKGFTHVIVDVRPITGYVLFDSKIAPTMFPVSGGQGNGCDYLGEFIKEGHKNGLKVFASMNVFAGGNTFSRSGILYDGQSFAANVEYTPDGLRSILDQQNDYNGMISPCDTSYGNYFISLLKELISKYPHLDGMMFDRVRYNGINTDFSTLSRKEFEKKLGHKVKNFPEDIFTWKKSGSGYEVASGEYYKKWISWRAGIIHDFIMRLRNVVKTYGHGMTMADYTGAWYPLYYKVGVNFASNDYDPARDYGWADSSYMKTGYASFLDILAVGNYYKDITIKASEKDDGSVWIETDNPQKRDSWYSVEGSCKNLRNIMCGHPFVGGVLVSQFYDDPAGIAASMKVNMEYSDGVMLFDISHIISHNLWESIPSL